MAFAQLKNNIKLYYEIHGEGEPLILISGFTADHYSWDLVVSSLAKHYQVIVFDNRGVGESDAPAGKYTLEEMTEDVVQLCQCLNIKQAHFIGNSMGGRILQQLCISYAQLVLSAVIANSYLKLSAGFLNSAKTIVTMRALGVPVEVMVRNQAGWAYSDDFLTDEMMNSMVKMMAMKAHPMTDAAYVSQLAVLENRIVENDLKSLSMPILLMSSDRDIICLEADIVRMHSILPKHTQHYSFKGVGHLPHIEKPQEFCQVVEKFIRVHRKTPSFR